jgi:nicotinamide-nucleotide amidase
VAYPAGAMDVSVVIVGDEILSGHVQEANAAFIAARAAHHGHCLHRVVIIGDDPKLIALEVAREIDGPSSLVIVCGGLGPTHDDRTMEGVAEALGRSVARCEPLAARIEEVVTYVTRHGFSAAAFGAEGLRKMAMAPEGAEILPSSTGFIPAVTLAEGETRIVILPGPPRELQAVFLESVEPHYLEGTGTALWREELTHGFPESTLASTLTELQRRFPSTAIGSYPQADHTLIRVAGPVEDATAAAEELRAHIAELSSSEEGRRLLDFVQDRRTRRRE